MRGDAMSALWTVIDGRLTHIGLPESIDYIMSAPYPSFWWSVSEGRLTHTGLPAPIDHIMSAPYPPFWWYVSNGRLTHEGLPMPIAEGAFYGCTALEKVYIPESVKSIGAHAFAGTALTSVTIASDCVYYGTSFPSGCTVNFYP